MIELKNIKKGYNGEPVLKGLSFTIETGDFVSIMGRSGSGKSTMLSIIGGFLDQDEGDVLWDGENIKEFSDDKMSYMRCNKIGFVFQNFKLISTLNVLDNIMLPSSLSEKSKDLIKENFEYYVKELGLDGLLEKFPNQLSGGQQQRVAIARALTFNPDILILDEPTGALDKANETKVMELISKVNKEKHMTIVQVTHSEKVASYATKILNMSDGVLQ